jgi:hypothetical protein
MSIAVFVLTTSRLARNPDNYRDGAARQINDQREFSVAKVPRNPSLRQASTVGGNSTRQKTLI